MTHEMNDDNRRLCQTCKREYFASYPEYNLNCPDCVEDLSEAE